MRVIHRFLSNAYRETLISQSLLLGQVMMQEICLASHKCEGRRDGCPPFLQHKVRVELLVVNC